METASASSATALLFLLFQAGITDAISSLKWKERYHSINTK